MPPKIHVITASPASTSASGTPKRRGRPPKNRAVEEEPPAKRPRGRPRKSDKPAALWCDESVKQLFVLRYDSNLRHKFEKKDNRSKRIGYEELAAKLSDKIGRRFDNTQVQQKLAQLHTQWTKLSPKEAQAGPAVHRLMAEYWGTPNASGNAHGDAEAPEEENDVVVVDRSPAPTPTPTPPTKQARAKRLAVNTEAAKPAKPAKRVLPQGTEESEDEEVEEEEKEEEKVAKRSSGLVQGSNAIKHGLTAIAKALANKSTTSVERKVDTLLELLHEQTLALREQSAQISKLVAVLGKDDN